MKGYIYAAYERKTRCEACLGVWDSIGELCRAMEIGKKAAYSNLYRTRLGGAGRSDIAIYRFSMP